MIVAVNFKEMWGNCEVRLVEECWFGEVKDSAEVSP
jgi:hypothetical protein